MAKLAYTIAKVIDAIKNPPPIMGDVYSNESYKLRQRLVREAFPNSDDFQILLDVALDGPYSVRVGEWVSREVRQKLEQKGFGSHEIDLVSSFVVYGYGNNPTHVLTRGRNFSYRSGLKSELDDLRLAFQNLLQKGYLVVNQDDRIGLSRKIDPLLKSG